MLLAILFGLCFISTRATSKAVCAHAQPCPCATPRQDQARTIRRRKDEARRRTTCHLLPAAPRLFPHPHPPRALIASASRARLALCSLNKTTPLPRATERSRGSLMATLLLQESPRSTVLRTPRAVPRRSRSTLSSPAFLVQASPHAIPLGLVE
eukprot:scaffold9940_cov104-Isochrysis_galbana.AAC.6